MGTIRIGWEDLYLLKLATSSAAIDFATGGGSGIASANEYGILLNEHPHLAAGVSRDINEKTTGLAENSSTEYVAGRQAPAVTLNMGLNDLTLGAMGWLLFQKGAVEATNKKTFVPPVKGGSGPEIWCSVARGIGDSLNVDKNQAIHGAICSSLGLNFTAGERVGVTAEMIGTTYATDFDLASTTALVAATTAADKLMYDYSFDIGGTDCSNFVESLDLTMVNNAATRYYGSQTPATFVLQRMTTSGTLKMAMSADTVGDNTQIDLYVAGTDTLLELRDLANGGSETALDSTSGYTRIRANMMYTGGDVDAAEELMVSLPFDCVNDTTYNSIEVIVNDGRSLSIPA